MDPQRADYFDYDIPPDRDLRFDWRAAAAITGLVLMSLLAILVAVVA